MESCSVTQSTLNSQVQAILLSQPPKSLRRCMSAVEVTCSGVLCYGSPSRDEVSPFWPGWSRILTLGDPHDLPSQSAKITGVSHHTCFTDEEMDFMESMKPMPAFGSFYCCLSIWLQCCSTYLAPGNLQKNVVMRMRWPFKVDREWEVERQRHVKDNHGFTWSQFTKPSVLTRFFCFFPKTVSLCYPGWSAVAPSKFTATSTSWVQ
ncbi:hypothetical protein AAY473_032080, partial [Plecturocebus cupreus]